MAYYQNWRGPWFERLTEARRSLEEREENRLQGENIHHPNTKWSFEYNLSLNKNYRGPASSFPCWSEVGVSFARLASKQEGNVVSGHVRSGHVRRQYFSDASRSIGAQRQFISSRASNSQRAFFLDRKPFPAGDCWVRDWRLRYFFVEIFAFAFRQK